EVAARRLAAERLRAARHPGRGQGLPAPLAAKLVGTTAEDIDAEIDELLPFLGAGAAPRGPKPNPQQGVPSLGSGGTLSAGRERYAAQHQ
ncbi:hypothetical protein H7H37_02005, partial [Mycolicibacterium insubricum]|nr:hypothetical protein [Mycolicibacterium insubricum]